MSWTEKDLKNLRDRGLHTLAQTGTKKPGGPAPLRAKAKKTNNNPNQLRAEPRCIITTDIGLGVYPGTGGVNYYYYQTAEQFEYALKAFNKITGIKVETE